MSWESDGKRLRREFDFPDFKTALVFVNKVGELAEAAQHHPDIELGWGRVAISLTTHDTGGVSTKDYELAGQIDELEY